MQITLTVYPKPIICLELNYVNLNNFKIILII